MEECYFLESGPHKIWLDNDSSFVDRGTSQDIIVHDRLEISHSWLDDEDEYYIIYLKDPFNISMKSRIELKKGQFEEMIDYCKKT